jgi:hypothetical protein
MYNRFSRVYTLAVTSRDETALLIISAGNLDFGFRNLVAEASSTRVSTLEKDDNTTQSRQSSRADQGYAGPLRRGHLGRSHSWSTGTPGSPTRCSLKKWI